jgi:hypothetical protein
MGLRRTGFSAAAPDGDAVFERGFVAGAGFFFVFCRDFGDFTGDDLAGGEDFTEHDFKMRDAFAEGAFAVDGGVATAALSVADDLGCGLRESDMGEPLKALKTGEAEECAVQAFAVGQAKAVARQRRLSAWVPRLFVRARAEESDAAPERRVHPRT